jgi:hypothetical protein
VYASMTPLRSPAGDSFDSIAMVSVVLFLLASRPFV